MMIKSRWALMMICLLIFTASGEVARATCTPYPGFAVFQCANEATFGTAPFPVALDPNGRPMNLTGVFWQIGFGNGTLSLGGPAGNSLGTGIFWPGSASTPVFNGNDSGLFPVDVVGFGVATGDVSPPGGLCLRNNNWGNIGVDGCADNWRSCCVFAYGRDGVLNPYFDDYEFAYNGNSGIYSTNSMQDYPMAVLLKGPAAVHSCNTTPVCDTTQA